MSIPFDLWGQRGWASAEVAGESHYRAAIRALFGARIEANGSEITVSAQLLPEPLNRHDRNAVAVVVGSAQVGYLPRESAARYSPLLTELVARGWTPQVGARVWGSEWNPGEFSGSVRLDLAEPHMILPANQPPQETHRLLPTGGAIQVTGEQHHLDTLAAWLRPEGECWVHATLHEITEQSARSSRTVVEVRIDGARIGQLSPRMSGEVLAAVRHLSERGLVAGVRAIVKGNRIKTEVIVYAARAHELPESWLNAPLDAAPRATVAPAPAGGGSPGGQSQQVAPAPAGGGSPGGQSRPVAPAEPVGPSAAETAVLRAPVGHTTVPIVPAPLLAPAPPPVTVTPPPVVVPVTSPGNAGVVAGDGRAHDVQTKGLPESMNAQAARQPQAPQRPAGPRFNPPPNWPAPPPGWSPPPGWAPDPSWGPPPAGWRLWGEESGPDPEIPLFGARGTARELAAEVERLRAEREELTRLGLFDVKDLMEQRLQLQREVADLQQRLDGLRRQVTAAEEPEARQPWQENERDRSWRSPQ